MEKNLFFVTLIAFYTFVFFSLQDSKIVYRHEVKLFFGLSIPSGGMVSSYDWDDFQQKEIATKFDGFNVVDSTGFYKGMAKPSKIVTFIVKGKEVNKIKKIAQAYAQRFHQNSVMILDDSLLKQEFIGPSFPVSY